MITVRLIPNKFKSEYKNDYYSAINIILTGFIIDFGYQTSSIDRSPDINIEEDDAIVPIVQMLNMLHIGSVEVTSTLVTLTYEPSQLKKLYERLESLEKQFERIRIIFVSSEANKYNRQLMHPAYETIPKLIYTRAHLITFRFKHKQLPDKSFEYIVHLVPGKTKQNLIDWIQQNTPYTVSEEADYIKVVCGEEMPWM